MSLVTKLRAEADAALAKTILEDRSVQRAIERFEKTVKAAETRRHLLSTAVRLDGGLVPELGRVIGVCRERLELETEVELYVYPSPHLNAACVRPEDERILLMFSSELLDAFEANELAFVVGHELGHHLLGHHDIPVGALLKGPGAVPPRIAMQLFAWSRYAEVSADRAGMWCARDLDAVARGLFKLASGLREGAASVVMETLLAQVEALEGFGAATGEGVVRADWFTTHPFSPLRLKAVQLFAQSDAMVEGGLDRVALETAVGKVMSIMEPGYLKETSEEAALMRQLFLAGAMLVAAAHGDVSETETEAIESLVGDGRTDRVSVEALRKDMPRRVRAVVASVPGAQRAHVLRDLCVVARADGHVAEEERELLEKLAKDLELPPEVVTMVLDGPVDLD